jgi:hypothetical protein
MVLSQAAWNAALTDVGARLVALEVERASFDALIAEGTGQALAVIQANVGPQLTALQASIAAAQTAINVAQDQVGSMETTILTTIINPAIATLQAQVTAAEASIATILAGNLPASQVVTDSNHLFTTSADKSCGRFRAHYMGMIG